MEIRTELIALYEESRKILFSTDPIEKKIKRISKSNPQLSKKLDEINKTFQADLLIFTDTINQLINCEDENEMKELIELLE